jgi:transposase
VLRPRCTRGQREPRIIGLQTREHFEVLQHARRHQETEAFRASYAARAGIEGTHAQVILQRYRLDLTDRGEVVGL